MADPTPEDIKAGYGFVALLGNAVPEINNILTQAIQGKWTPDRFVMSVANTNWWKNTPAATREWIIKSSTDPAQAAAEQAAGADKVRILSAQLGLPMPDFEKARQIWFHSRIYNLDEEGTKAHIARTVSMDDISMNDKGFGAGGVFGQMVNDMFKLASDYGYTSTDLSREILDQTMTLMRVGVTNADTTTWQSKMIDYAASKFAPYADDIRGGKTVADVARPITDRVSSLLEMNPAALDLNDPLMKKALTEWGAENRAYSLNEVENFARQDSRWKTTDNAMESSVKLLNELGQTFGMLGGGR